MDRNEAQTRRDLIDPKLFLRDWTNDLVKVEITPGGTDIVNGKPKRRRGRSDYLLCIKIGEGKPVMPIAILEAKKERSPCTLGLQQSQGYAKRFNVPFAFSTNGHKFSEYSEDKGTIDEYDSLDIFPTPSELIARYEAYKKIKLQSEEAKALFTKYKSGESTRFYYQDAAIRSIFETIAVGRKKMMLCLATGTGKTFIAKELLWRLSQAGHLRRALFLIDRDELRTQAITHLQGVFGDDAQEVTTSNPATNAKILIATYQTLNIASEDSTPDFWRKNFPPDFFSHIIIDECHRSAWGKWSIVLTDNPNAIQIGLTATPRLLTGEKGEEGKRDEEITANNIKYFGEPVYEYSIADGQNDGYLAACEVIKRRPDIDSLTLVREELETKNIADAYTGETVTGEDLDDIYSATDFEKQLLLDDRVQSMCSNLFNELLQTGGPHQKTIIFCASDIHAEKVAIQLHNLYRQWCRQTGAAPKESYAYKVTAKGGGAKDYIAELRGSSNSHFIATTVELLSTGVDVPNLNNVVFFKYVKSAISFYQMVGRGTRIGEPRGSKLMFRIFDYTNATRLFGKDFISKPASPPKEGLVPPPVPGRIVEVAGQQYIVQIEDEGKSILVEEDGQDVLIPYEIYKERLATTLTEKVQDIETLKKVWVNPNNRKDLLNELPGGSTAVYLVRELEEEQECDLYDVLAQLGFGTIPKTRGERAAGFTFRNKPWLKAFPDKTQKVLEAIASQFAKGGIEELETKELFDVEEIASNGGVEALSGLSQEPTFYIHETKLRLLA
ncbi:MAG: DEAD/DEAH box helicase family protein [Chitinophagaceae bacterium]|nr:DEAD/DEAH box helicase family protein [Chitinophagaceae bacterium]